MDSIRQIVLLHGWGCDAHVWQPSLPFFKRYAQVATVDIQYSLAGEKQSLDQLCGMIAKQIPEGSLLCGWSLGGMLAMRIAVDYPEKIKGLMTLASNLVFVENEQWQYAMPIETFNEFFALFERKPKQALKRFQLLEVHGDQQAKAQLQFLQSLTIENDDTDLMRGLKILREINNIDSINHIDCPALYCFGENDALVPSKASDAFESKCKESQKTRVFTGCGHFLHYPEERLSEYLSPFLAELCQ